ncbi:MAG: RpiB/LacA/LacB family sugar-phosphate isomerase [Spirochaetaceae bacterium]|nr:RpiB/LacA/LacB family sugar-phosphate isomerase [Spirochaetaceae bacterium]
MTERKGIDDGREKDNVHEVFDLGSADPIYANVVIEVGEAVATGIFDRGIVLCGTGIGVSIAANKVPGVYCALVTDAYQAERAALSNNANVIALGAQVTGTRLGRMLVRTYMANVHVPGGRSEPKVRRIAEYSAERTR